MKIQTQFLEKLKMLYFNFYWFYLDYRLKIMLMNDFIGTRKKINSK